IFYEDASRDLACGTGARVLLTEFWYPAEEGSGEENTVHDFFIGRWDEVVAPGNSDLMLDLPTGSYRDVAVHPQAYNLPVVLFSHGFTSNRFQNYRLAAFLASHGYVVVSADHICESMVTLTEDAVVKGVETNPLAALDTRVKDLLFLLDQIEESPPQLLTGRLDTEQIAVAGHSWGAVSATELIKDDDRPRALVQIAGFGFTPAPEVDELGTLALWGLEDEVMAQFENWRDEVLAALPPPVYELDFIDTGHFAFCDLCDFVPELVEQNGCGVGKRAGTGEEYTNPTPAEVNEILGAYAVAFLGAMLYEVPELEDWLTENHFPERIEYGTVLP
ncbi:MAG: hypothetical protein HN348_06635, partial [Proteobacteria bacterium]|nr:hypothetical protein [Pseudomonadota bacterium]